MDEIEKMVIKINKYMDKSKIKNKTNYFVDHIKCIDGFTISVQGGIHHYCKPKRNWGPYTQVEAGFPTYNDKLIEEYREDDIYPYIPIEVIAELLIKHGGFDRELWEW